MCLWTQKGSTTDNWPPYNIPAKELVTAELEHGNKYHRHSCVPGVLGLKDPQQNIGCISKKADHKE
jgi:hypothetical protein